MIRPLRICLVASELLGAHKNGGIGTATTHLALFLARVGHAVSVLYTGGSPVDHANVWSRRCAAAGVAVTHLDARRGEIYPVLLRETCVIFEHLRTRDDDLVLFQDWQGPAFSSVVAKRTGLAFARTLLGVIAHGPTAWLLDANFALVRDKEALAHLHMEREALAGADLVVTPSRYLLDWMRADGQLLPADTQALPLYLWSDPDEEVVPARDLAHVDTLAFFGRLETRKGVDLFLEAVLSDALALSTFDLVFLGRPASHTPERIRDTVAARRPDLLSRMSFETDLDTDAAQDFLRRTGALAVIPSLTDNAPCVISECLRRGLPFVSTAVGGIPELVAEADRGRVLVPPQPAALAARLAAVLGQPFEPARGAYAEADVARRWMAWLDGLPVPRAGAPAPAVVRNDDRKAAIAVVATHYERPVLLHQSLEALAAQTRTDFEVVVVDDGSRSPEAIEGLRAAEARAWPFRLKVLRTPNRYLGAARNTGLGATVAGRVIFMDDDNLAFPDLVETLDRAMTLSGADIVTCQLALFRDPLGPADPAELFTADRWGFLGGPLELGLSINCFGDATGIYRREVFATVGGYHEEHGVGFEDWHLHARAGLAGFRTVSLPVPLFWYRRLPTGMSVATNIVANNRTIWRAYEAHLPPGLRRLVELSVRNVLTGDAA